MNVSLEYLSICDSDSATPDTTRLTNERVPFSQGVCELSCNPKVRQLHIAVCRQ